MKRRGLIAIGAAAFLWTLVMHAPAATLYGWLVPASAPVRLLGLDGTLAEGHAAGITNGANTVLRDVRWRLQPLQLLLLRVAFRIDSSEPVTVHSRIEFTPFGLRIVDTAIGGGLKALLGIAGFGYLPVDGLIDGDIDHLKLHNGMPAAATAVLQVRGLNWSLAKPPILLGDFRAAVDNDGDAIVAKIDSPTGPLQVQGEARLAADGSYTADVRLKAKPQADEMTQNLLHSLGQPDAQGEYRLRYSGQLPGGTPAQNSPPRAPPP